MTVGDDSWKSVLQWTGQLQEMGHPTPQGALREHDGERQSLHLFEAGEVDGLEDVSMINYN